MKRFSLLLPLIAACATPVGIASRDLVEARAMYQRAATSPAARVAPDSVAAARVALKRAEDAPAASDMERHYAFIAKRRAQLAMLKVDRIAAERDAQALHADLQTRTAQAPQVVQAPSGVTVEVTTTTPANQQQLATQVEVQKKEIDRLDRELADTRRQLSERKDLADAESKKLKDQEAALQAQIDALQADRTKAQQERDQALATLRAFASINENDDRGLVITVPAEVMFRFGSARLLPRAKEKLDDLAAALNRLGTEQTFVIEGHTDSRGSAEFNRRLSKRRADSVRAYLIEQGVSRDRIIARGRGEDDPVASNTDPEGRANNRRVEIVVTPSVVGGR